MTIMPAVSATPLLAIPNDYLVNRAVAAATPIVVIVSDTEI